MLDSTAPVRSTHSVSVLIPVWNQLPVLLDAAVLSAVNAGAEQVIVVDDGSDTPIANTFGGTVEVHRIEHRGVPAAVNEALKHVRCEYVARFASDDEMDPNKLDVQLGLMKANDWIASFHDCRDSRTGKKYPTGMRETPHQRTAWRKRLRASNRFYGGTSIIRSDIAAMYRHPLDLPYGHDWLWNCSVETRVGWNYIPEVLSTIGRYEHGLEAQQRRDPAARKVSKRAKDYIERLPW